MSEYVRCVGCGEIVEATEPCSCLFDVIGTLDAQGVLHTAERVAVRFAVPCCYCEQLFEPDLQQVDAWGQSGRNFEPTDWVCQECDNALDADVAHMREVEERAWLETERAAAWAVQQFVSQTMLTDEEEAVIGAQVDAWSDRGMSWEDIVAMEPRAMFLPTR